MTPASDQPKRGDAHRVDVSVIAVSWNTASCLPAALDGLPGACSPRSYEIIVVDNGSTDESVSVLRKRADVELIELDSNTGFTHAANVGSARARGTYLLFLNPDVLAPPGSIAALATLLDEHPEAYGATPWFRNPDGSPQYFWRRIPGGLTAALCLTKWGTRLDRLAGGRMMRRRNYGELPDPPGVVPILGVGAACLLVRRRDFESVDRFDERYFNFFQDAELERQMHDRGRVLLGAGTVEVVHEKAVTLRTLPEWEVEGQFLYALRQFLSGAAWYHRVTGEAAIRLDLALRRRNGAKRRELALRKV